MPLLPQSHRRRRQLAWVSAAATLVLVGVVVAIALPEHSPPPALKHQPPAAPNLAIGGGATTTAEPARLTAADRREIDHALDVFLPAVMERKDLALGWTLAGPEVKSAQTRAQWVGGSTPIPDYQAKETTFHTWEPIDVEPGSVIFNIVLHPGKGETQPSTEFSGQVVRRGGRWLVNRLYTIATFGVTKTTSEVGPADFGAPASHTAAPSTKNAGAIGKIGLLPILGILGLVFLVPLSFGLIAVRRARRFKKETAGASRDMPSLPSSYRRS